MFGDLLGGDNDANTAPPVLPSSSQARSASPDTESATGTTPVVAAPKTLREALAMLLRQERMSEALECAKLLLLKQDALAMKVQFKKAMKLAALDDDDDELLDRATELSREWKKLDKASKATVEQEMRWKDPTGASNAVPPMAWSAIVKLAHDNDDDTLAQQLVKEFPQLDIQGSFAHKCSDFAHRSTTGDTKITPTIIEQIEEDTALQAEAHRWAMTHLYNNANDDGKHNASIAAQSSSSSSFTGTTVKDQMSSSSPSSSSDTEYWNVWKDILVEYQQECTKRLAFLQQFKHVLSAKLQLDTERVIRLLAPVADHAAGLFQFERVTQRIWAMLHQVSLVPKIRHIFDTLKDDIQRTQHEIDGLLADTALSKYAKHVVCKRGDIWTSAMVPSGRVATKYTDQHCGVCRLLCAPKDDKLVKQVSGTYHQQCFNAWDHLHPGITPITTRAHLQVTL